MQVKVSQAITLITAIIKAKLVPMLSGSPGCGKSEIAYKIAADYNLKVIDLRLSQCDPTDLLGFPTIMGNKAGYVPMDTFPIAGDALPEGYSGWLLFLDEFNSASPAVQAAAYKLILDRMVGMHHLHQNVAIMCAGNLETDNAIVQPMSTALQSRLVHMELVIDSGEWLDWANNFKLNHHIVDYIKFKPSALFTFRPDHTDSTYACPRTWSFLSRLMAVMPASEPESLQLYAGTVSEGVAREFITFCKIYDTLPKIKQIEAAPDTIKMPTEISVQYAITGALANNATESNLSQLMKFIVRMPHEFQVITVRETTQRNKALLQHPAIIKWRTDFAEALF